MSPDQTYYYDILECAKKIVRITKNMTFEEFETNDLIQDSVIRQIEIIGEAARQVSETSKEIYHHIEWHKMKGMRNHLIHDYKEIDMLQVWDTIQISIPELIKQIEPLVPPEE